MSTKSQICQFRFSCLFLFSSNVVLRDNLSFHHMYLFITKKLIPWSFDVLHAIQFALDNCFLSLPQQVMVNAKMLAMILHVRCQLQINPIFKAKACIARRWLRCWDSNEDFRMRNNGKRNVVQNFWLPRLYRAAAIVCRQ